MQYTARQMEDAIADVDRGKPVKKAAREHGIPLRSLYHKLKMRAKEKKGQESGSAAMVVVESEGEGEAENSPQQGPFEPHLDTH
jgi:hypothetical protein